MLVDRARKRIGVLLMGTVSLLLALCTAPPAAAQVLYGSLTGYITDPSGAAIPGAKVEALNTGTGVVQTTTTDQAGLYLITTLPPGRYNVTVSATNFSTITETGVIINVNVLLRLNAQLKVAHVVETVNVKASAELMQTDRSDVHTDLVTKPLTDLPEAGSVGRNFETLLKLIPGVQPPTEQNSVAGNPERSMAFNVNGVSWVNNTVRLDGAPDIYQWLPYLMAYVPPEEAIQEVNVVTNSFLPEQGTAGGSAVNVIIRSGSNQFHGAAWEYNTNTDFNARTFFFNPKIILPKDILNQFGARMGGPIKRNKLFFFGDWERTMQREFISGFGTLPTAALEGGDFTGTTTTIYDPTTGNADGTGRSSFTSEYGANKIPSTMIDPVVAHYISLLPSPNLPGTTNNYFGAAEYGYNRDNADGKLDYQIDQKDRIFYRYSISKGAVNDPFQLGAADGGTWDGGQPGTGHIMVTNMGAGGSHTFSPTMVIDGNAGYDRQHLFDAAPDVNTIFGTNGVPYIAGTNTGTNQGGIPYFNVTNGWIAMGNSNTGNPFEFRDNSYVANANFTKIHSSHSMRFGWDYTHMDLNHFQPQGGSFLCARGSFQFTGGLTALKGGTAPNLYNSWADFLLGLPYQEGKAQQTVVPDALRWSTWAFYAQDQFQVTRKLTLSYGLRYEYYPFVTRDHTGNYTFVPSTGNVLIGCEGGVPCNTGVDVGHGNILPRLGVAYRLNDRTVLRAGGGINMDPDNWRDMRGTYPAFINTTYLGPNSYNAAGALTGGNGITSLPQGTLMLGLPIPTFPNIKLGTIPLPPNLTTQAVANPFHRGYIEGWNATVERDLGSGFTATVSYVGTHEVRQMSNVNIDASYPGGGTAGELLYPINTTGNINEDFPFASAMYSGLQTQVMHRAGGAQIGVVYTYSHAMDYGDNSTYNGLTFAYPTYWLRDRADAGYDRTHNFQAWTVYELPFGKGHRLVTTGPASKILGGWEFNNILSAASGTPFTVTASGTILNAPGNTEVANQVLPTVAKPGAIGPGQLWFNTAAFGTPSSGTFGNLGRNSMRGPGYFEWDTGLFRNFNLFSEKYQLQFRAESIAVTNTPIFSNPGATIGSSTFGQITSTAVSANGVNTGGGNRVIRLALKFYF
jgi:hypothetical protein